MEGLPAAAGVFVVYPLLQERVRQYLWANKDSNMPVTHTHPKGKDGWRKKEEKGLMGLLHSPLLISFIRKKKYTLCMCKLEAK